MPRKKQAVQSDSGLTVAKPARPSKFFISYAHDDADGQQLAAWLHDQLIKAGHEAFIDQDIPLGANWSHEIDRRIAWCDWMVVLLSAGSIQSDMVIGEVSQARDLRKRREQRGEGLRPNFLPVHVRLSQENLEYRLNAFLSGIQYSRWETAADSQRILREVIDAAGGELPVKPPHPGALRAPALPRSEPVPSTLSPAADPRPPAALAGPLQVDDRFYIARAADDEMLALAPLSSQMIVIKAPRQTGKSSALQRYLAACEGNKKQVVVVDLAIVHEPYFESFASLLRCVTEEVLHQLRRSKQRLPELVDQQDVTHFFEDHVLADISRPIVLAVDEADRVLGQDYQTSFFAMFRAWQALQRRSAPWQKLDVALVISTEPYLLIRNPRMSPFNVATIIELHPFTEAECRLLHGRWNGNLSERELHRLYEFVAGQPFLTQLALSQLSEPRAVTLREMMKNAIAARGRFGEHLRALLHKLQSQPELVDTMKQIIRGKSPSSDDDVARLIAAGLVRQEGKRTIPANDLYRQFFQSVL